MGFIYHLVLNKGNGVWDFLERGRQDMGGEGRRWVVNKAYFVI